MRRVPGMLAVVLGAVLVALGALPTGWLGRLYGLGGGTHRTADVVAGAGVVVFILGLGGLLRRKPTAPPTHRLSWPRRLYDRIAQGVDRTIGWDHLPTPLGLAVLVGIRDILRQRNLYDTSRAPGVNRPPVALPDPRYLTAQTPDGTYNDLGDPAMGMARARFGRNVPLARTVPDPEPALMLPNPRTVSLELLTRDTLVPATTVNLLAAAWIQFMVHDWVSHGIAPNPASPWRIPVGDDDPWPDHPMTIMRAHPDPTRPPGPSEFPPTHVNLDTHWWDVSQVYGVTEEAAAQVRSGERGRLKIGDDGLMRFPADPQFNFSVQQGWWLGLEMMTTLFTLEHNAICDRLASAYPSWSDDQLFDRAQLVNSALTAKIHTVEWTPAIISHPTTRAALRANWFGLQGEWLHRHFGRLSRSEAISGIPGSRTDYFGVPYSLTKEFVAVYRMHPLILDDYHFRSLDGDRELGVPRYNEFRRLMHLAPVKSFEALTHRRDWADELRRLYDGDIERVDLMIGMYAERRPRGFAFSDTAFRVFALMASRRLNSGRFFTTDYTPRVYSQAGMDWIRDNSMSTVLLRHHPQLRPALRRVKNAFAPWPRAMR